MDADDVHDGDSHQEDADTDDREPVLPPVPDPPANLPSVQSMARGFQLYYRERVERAVIAYNRFAIFGGPTFASNNNNVAVARTGNSYEVVPIPADNNHIGLSTWMTYSAYRIHRTRTVELSLVRMFNGLVFYEEVSGHPGVTSREVFPGWTRVMDGVSGAISLTRFGTPVSHPMAGNDALEAEILGAFYNGVSITYRENPEEFYFSFLPAFGVGQYAVTHSFSQLPRYLRVSDCCSSLMRTPDDRPWTGSYWGNHNSRDNFPDIAYGFIAARAAATDPEASSDVRAAAARAVAAGQRVGDLILSSDSSLMTVDEHNPYDTLVIGGTVRPDGEVENQDLGSLGVCTAAYLAQAISSAGLSMPAPDIPLPGSLDVFIFAPLDFIFECDIPDEPFCSDVSDAWCGHNWGTFGQLEVAGIPLMDFLRDNPDMAPTLVSGFQDDFDEMTMGALALVHYARVVDDEQLYERSRATLYFMAELMADLADLAFPDRPEQRALLRYRAALYKAQAELPAPPADLNDFTIAEQQVGYLENLLNLGEAGAAALLSDDQIRAAAEEQLSRSSDTAVARYRAEYGESPPLRRAGEGYEARGAPLAERPWVPVERPHHHHLGAFRLLRAIPLCELAPQLLDCTWARLGCAVPDLDGNHRVDASDSGRFNAAFESHSGASCDESNGHCGGADLDRDGRLTADDQAFMEAARGCFY